MLSNRSRERTAHRKRILRVVICFKPRTRLQIHRTRDHARGKTLHRVVVFGYSCIESTTRRGNLFFDFIQTLLQMQKICARLQLRITFGQRQNAAQRNADFLVRPQIARRMQRFAAQLHQGLQRLALV